MYKNAFNALKMSFSENIMKNDEAPHAIPSVLQKGYNRAKTEEGYGSFIKIRNSKNNSWVILFWTYLQYVQ